MTKKKEKKVEENPKRINLFQSSYHFYRNSIKQILLKGKVNGFRFVKNEKDWNGFISIPPTEIEKAKKVLADYKTKNPDEVSMWW